MPLKPLFSGSRTGEKRVRVHGGSIIGRAEFILSRVWNSGKRKIRKVLSSDNFRRLPGTGLSEGPCSERPVDGSSRLKKRLKENEEGKSGIRDFGEGPDFPSDRKKSAKEGHVRPEGSTVARSLQDLPDFCPRGSLRKVCGEGEDPKTRQGSGVEKNEWGGKGKLPAPNFLAEPFSSFLKAFPLSFLPLSNKKKGHVDSLRGLRTAPRGFPVQTFLPGGESLPEEGGGDKGQKKPHGSLPKSPSP